MRTNLARCALIRLTAMGILGMALGGLAVAHAENMIEIGAGAQKRSFAQDTAVLLKVGFSSREDAEGGEYYVARLKGTGAIGTGKGSELVPQVEIEVTAYERYVNKLQFADLVQGLGGAVIRGGFTRDLGLGQSLGLSVSVIGIRAGTVDLKEGDAGAGLFAQLAADMVGFKFLKYVDDQRQSFSGMRIADVRGEIGAILATGESFSVKLAAGAGADLNYGTVVQINARAFAGVRIDVARFLRFFVEGSLNGSRLSVKDADAILDSYSRVEGGLSFQF